jgi:hypothetical protein
MEQAELDAFAARTAALVGAVADVALKEGDITPETLNALADALDALADGTISVALHALLEHLDLDGYGALALTVALTELDARLEDRGAYEDDGFLNDAGRLVIGAIANTLRRE